MRNLIAEINLSPNGGFSGFGPLGLQNGEDAPNIFNSFISGAIGIMTIVAAIWFIFLFISGAIAIMGAGGDKQAMETARKRIANGIIGLAVVVAAIFLIEIIQTIFGFNYILNPAQFIKDFSF
jgi:hypothetical protein